MVYLPPPTRFHVPIPALESRQHFSLAALHARGRCVQDLLPGHIEALRQSLHRCHWSDTQIDRYIGFGYHVQDLGHAHPNRRARVLAWLARRIGAHPCQSGHTHRLIVYTHPKAAALLLVYVASEVVVPI